MYLGHQTIPVRVDPVGTTPQPISVASLPLPAGAATEAATVDVLLIKRSTDNTGGTFVAGTAVPHDSADPGASVTVGHYTANPTVGTPVGTVTRRKVCLPIGTTAAGDVNTPLLPAGEASILDKPIVLCGTAQVLCVNNNGAAIPAGGANWYVSCTWIEE